MPDVTTIAEFWDCEIEHCYVKMRWTNPILLNAICDKLGTRAPRKLGVLYELRKMAESRAREIEQHIGDKILTFEDGSRLAIVAFDANTMEGDSRVMEPGETNIRAKVRGGKPYRHGITKSAWHWTRNGKNFGKPDTSPIADSEVEAAVTAYR